MKNTYYTPYFLFVMLLGATMSSCDLTNDLDKMKHPYYLVADKAIIDQKSAEYALAGAYAKLQFSFGEQGGLVKLILFPSLLGITANANYPDPETQTYLANSVFVSPFGTPSNRKAPFISLYNLIVRCNFVIGGATKLRESAFSNKPERKKEIIGEAKALRAMAHFYLLRLWGQFYDNSSEYGIVVRTRNKDKLRPRSTVSETYDAIYKDLDYAIAHAPDLRAKYFVSKTFAKGLKAKALLYQGKYGEAATLANEVISQKGNFDLTKNFADIFDHRTVGIYSTKELLFCVYGQKRTRFGSPINSNLWNGTRGGSFLVLSEEFRNNALRSFVAIAGQKIMYDGKRIKEMSTPKQKAPPPFNIIDPQIKKYKNFFSKGEIYETIYHLRMAEIYLIFAEAEARNKGSVTKEALDALNTVRKRAGATTTGKDGFETFPASITHAQFLEAVRMEKIMELFGEMGEHWYDLVRYAYADGGFDKGFKVSNVKPSALKPHMFILPIPLEELVLESKGLVKQNPGYRVPK